MKELTDKEYTRLIGLISSEWGYTEAEILEWLNDDIRWEPWEGENEIHLG